MTEFAEPAVEPPSGSPPAPFPRIESRGHRLRRHGHRAGLYAAAVVLVALFAALVVLIASNTRRVKLDWAFGSTRASLVWIVLATAVIGWLAGIATAETFRRRTRRPR